MLASKVKMSGSEKKKKKHEQEHMQHYIHKTCKLEDSRCSRATTTTKRCEKRSLYVQSCFFDN